MTTTEHMEKFRTKYNSTQVYVGEDFMSYTVVSGAGKEAVKRANEIIKELDLSEFLTAKLSHKGFTKDTFIIEKNKSKI